MQMGRLFEIVYLLQERKNVTAGELAKRFEVSVRTIYRDIEQLSFAGIPIYASKGRGGGIRILEEFVLNKSVLTEKERSQIIWALQGISAVKGADGGEALSKLSSLFGTGDTNWIEADFSDWGEDNSALFETMKTAVTEKLLIEMNYYNSSGEKGYRCIEPLQLYFKDKAWYIKAYCRKAEGFRLFRMTRMRNVCLLEEHFKREFHKDCWQNAGRETNLHMVSLTLKIDKSQSFRVFDEFCDEHIVQQEDGSFLATLICPVNDWIYGYILSYGGMAEVMTPEWARENIKTRIHELKKIYF